MTATKISALVFIALLAGCKGDKKCDWSGDDATQANRHTYFIECLRTAKQATNNHEDDNGHLVDSCESAAYYQSMKLVCGVDQ